MLPAPVWRIGTGQVPEPDVVMVQADRLGAHAVEGTPLLVVEVLSPANRGADLVRKRALYAEAGCPSYWIVDPGEPSVLVLALAGSSYTDRARVSGTDTLAVMDPVTVTLCPASLVSAVSDSPAG